MATGSVRSQPAVTEPSASAAPATARSPQPPRAAAPARPVGQTVRATAAPAARSPRPAPRPEPAADEPLVAHSDAEERTGWRAALIDWGNAALSSPERGIQPPPLDGAAPMIALAERFALEPAAVRALALLYAGWLLGYGDSGLPAAQVARAIGEEDDWRESLGRGELERHGMARSRRGRLRLRRVVGRFLDGGAPGTVATHPPQRAAKPTATPTSLVPLGARETLAAAAVRCAAALGRDVAPINLPEGPPKRLARRLADGLFEARVLGAVPLVPWCAALEPELARLVAAGALIAVPEGELSAALIRLPVLRTSPDAAP
jgi:hypothetical protein